MQQPEPAPEKPPKTIQDLEQEIREGNNSLKSKEEREVVLREALGKELLLELSEGQTLAMNADFSLSWFKLNKLRGKFRSPTLPSMYWLVFTFLLLLFRWF